MSVDFSPSNARHRTTWVSAPYRFLDIEDDCPHCALADDEEHGQIVHVSNGYWCRSCANRIAHSALTDREGSFEYERYRVSNAVRLIGGYEDGYPDQMVRRDPDSLLD